MIILNGWCQLWLVSIDKDLINRLTVAMAHLSMYECGTVNNYSALDKTRQNEPTAPTSN